MQNPRRSRDPEGDFNARDTSSPEIEERLEKLARKTGRTKTYHAREAILKYLDDLEESHLAKGRYAAYLASKSRSTPLEDVERPIGLAD